MILRKNGQYIYIKVRFLINLTDFQSVLIKFLLNCHYNESLFMSKCWIRDTALPPDPSL